MGTISLNRGQLTADLRGVEGEAQTLGQRMGASFGKVGAAFQKFVIGAAVAGTAAIVGFGVAGVKAFSEFEKGMREVFTLLPGLDKQIRDELTQGVKDLSEELGIIPGEVVPALYQAISAGIPPENVLDFLRTAGKAAIGGVTDLKTSVDGLTSVVAAYGPATMSATRAADIMFTGVKLGKTTFEEFSAALFQAVPIASQVGVSFETVSAWLAQLTLQGTPTSVAMTQIRAALVALTNDSTEASKVFEELTGKSFPQFIAEGGSVADALDILRRYSDESGISLAALFGRVEGAMAVLGVTGKQLDGFRDKVAQMGASAGATDKAFAEMEGGLAHSFARLRAWWDVTLIGIGEALEKPVRDFATFLEQNKDKIRDMVVNLFRNLALALQWFVDNRAVVVAALAAIAAGLGLVWVATHPIPAAIAAVAAAIAVLVAGARDSRREVEKLTGEFERMAGVTTSLYEALGAMGSELGLTRAEIALLIQGLDAAIRRAQEYADKTGDAAGATDRWRKEVVVLLDHFKGAFPLLADLLDTYMAQMEREIAIEIKLRAEQKRALDETTQAAKRMTQAQEQAAGAARVGLEGYEEHLRRTRKENEAQVELYYRLQKEAMAYSLTLPVLQRGSAAWEKEAEKARVTLEALMILQNTLAPANQVYVDGIDDAIRALRGLGIEIQMVVDLQKKYKVELVEFVAASQDGFLAFTEYLLEWARVQNKVFIDTEGRMWSYVWSLESALKYLEAGLVQIGRTVQQQFSVNVVNALRAAWGATAEYEAATKSATERFIERVQSEGKSYEEREKMIAEAVRRGLLTQEEANAALARMTDEKIKAEKSAIEELARAHEEAAKKKEEAEKGWLRTALEGVARYLQALAEEATALAIAEGIMAGILLAAATAAAVLLQFAVAAKLYAEAGAAAARALGYAGKAAALFAASWVVRGLSQLAEGGVAIGPTLAVVGEGQHEEAVLPLSDAVFAKIGAGIVDAMGKMQYPDMARWPEYRYDQRVETVSMERMFDGATINVRDKSDLEDLAAEIYRRFVDRQRGVGAVGVIR